MGIDVQTLRFLKYVFETRGAFGRVLTVGRQGVHCSPHIQHLVLGRPGVAPGSFCEPLLISNFGATCVDSIDASDYEGATVVHDLNEPFVHDMGTYDTVFDGGCLEHIFDVAAALRNLTKVCREGGQLIHVLPANNQCGHGFWQFSPELFFSLYSSSRGFFGTEVFVGDVIDPNWIFKVNQPAAGSRHDIRHPNPIYVMARTTLVSRPGNDRRVYQSDYLTEWSR